MINRFTNLPDASVQDEFENFAVGFTMWLKVELNASRLRFHACGDIYNQGTGKFMTMRAVVKLYKSTL